MVRGLFRVLGWLWVVAGVAYFALMHQLLLSDFGLKTLRHFAKSSGLQWQNQSGDLVHGFTLDNFEWHNSRWDISLKQISIQYSIDALFRERSLDFKKIVAKDGTFKMKNNPAPPAPVSETADPKAKKEIVTAKADKQGLGVRIRVRHLELSQLNFGREGAAGEMAPIADIKSLTAQEFSLASLVDGPMSVVIESLDGANKWGQISLRKFELSSDPSTFAVDMLKLHVSHDVSDFLGQDTDLTLHGLASEKDLDLNLQLFDGEISVKKAGKDAPAAMSMRHVNLAKVTPIPLLRDVNCDWQFADPKDLQKVLSTEPTACSWQMGNSVFQMIAIDPALAAANVSNGGIQTRTFTSKELPQGLLAPASLAQWTAALLAFSKETRRPPYLVRGASSRILADTLARAFYGKLHASLGNGEREAFNDSRKFFGVAEETVTVPTDPRQRAQRLVQIHNMIRVQQVLIRSLATSQKTKDRRQAAMYESMRLKAIAQEQALIKEAQLLRGGARMPSAVAPVRRGRR